MLYRMKALEIVPCSWILVCSESHQSRWWDWFSLVNCEQFLQVGVVLEIVWSYNLLYIHTHKCMHTHIIYIYTHTNACALTYIYIHIYIYLHPLANIHTHAHTHMLLTHMRIHAHTLIHSKFVYSRARLWRLHLIRVALVACQRKLVTCQQNPKTS